MQPMSLSIIIPVYNREDLIGDTLLSLLRQTLSADEIILVDDGSTDSTVDAAQAAFQWFTHKFSSRSRIPDFKVIRQQNAGPAAARNRGLAESKGEYLHFFDSDDIAAPNKHQVQLHAIRESSADIAICPWQMAYINGSRYSPLNNVIQQTGINEGSLVKALLTSWALIPTCCIFSRRIVEYAGAFPEDCFGTEDTLLFLSCFLGNAKCIHTPETFALYRVGNVKITKDNDGGLRHLTESARLLLKMRMICLSTGLDPACYFSFRARCWQAMRDIENSEAPDLILLNSLREVAKGSPDWVYASRSLFSRFAGGVKQRVIGNRLSHFFQTGPLAAHQIDLMREAGYEISR